MVKNIALVAMFGLHTEGAIGMDVMLTRPRIGYMSIAHVDVPVILAIAVVICSWQKCTTQEVPLILGFVTEPKVLSPTLAPANT